MKGRFQIVKITKQEKEYLISQGVKFGYGGISHTDSRHRRSYYLCESRYNMRLLQKYRDSKITK